MSCRPSSKPPTSQSHIYFIGPPLHSTPLLSTPHHSIVLRRRHWQEHVLIASTLDTEMPSLHCSQGEAPPPSPNPPSLLPSPYLPPSPCLPASLPISIAFASMNILKIK
ncbi:hypothetical protein TcWFU_003620 [Taenia crassiceps]|uniref:Uncharacterized protein n=1 Tax=Taenia crassiceps TaxID=6207 RepID=A0ABR4QGN7_9CEST